VDDAPVKSCTTSTESCAGAAVTTVESLDRRSGPHPMLLAFRKHGVPACAMCTPGVLLAAIAYAARDRELTKEEIRQDLVAEICRCEHADRISCAVHDGARAMHGR
jgi:aerobic-type carbon monoxide dehydrogenase small subunit (CoxS/CutS family)